MILRSSESFIHNIWSHETFDTYLKKFTFECIKFILDRQIFHVLPTNECSLTYNQNYCSAFIFKTKIKSVIQVLRY